MDLFGTSLSGQTSCLYAAGAHASVNSYSGGVKNYQWSYRTTSTGPLIPLAAANSATYNYDWNIFDHAATYYLVCVVTPQCGTPVTVQTGFDILPAITPTVTANGPTTLCSGGSVVLSAPAASSYLWSNGATTQSITVTQAGDYSVRISNGQCYSYSSITHVSVVGAPATPTITANGPTTFCAGGSVMLTASAASSYLWSNGETTQSIVVNATANYTVTVTDANGCSATSAPKSVLVNALPTPAITANGPATFCAGSKVTLTATSAASYLWSNGATTQSIDVTTSGNYTVTVTDSNGCSATSPAVSVTRDADLDQPTITSTSPSICPGGSVTMTAHATGGNGVYTYQWYDINGVIAGATPQIYTVSPTSNHSYYVVATDSLGCSSTSSSAVNVTVNSTPDATITGASATCAGAGTSASVPDAGAGATYNWTISGGAIDSTTANAAIFFHPNSGSTSITLGVTVTTAAGCSATSAQKTVTVNPLPPLTFSTVPAAVCLNTEAAQEVVPTAGVTYS